MHRLFIVLNFLLIGATSLPLHAQGGAEQDELVMKQNKLLALNNETDQLANEIKELERVSIERAQKIKALNAKIQAARRNLEVQQAEIVKVKAKADAIEKTEAASATQLAGVEAQLKTVNEELAKVQAQYAKADAHGKAEMAKIEQERQEELKRRAELNQRIKNFDSYVKKESGKRSIAREQVDNISHENDRLYDRLKGH